MNYLTIVGNIGADAEVINSNGNKFVSFRVADSQRYTSQDGQQHESTQWVRCAMNGDGGKLLQFLRKGARVCVIGRMATRVYSSQKERRMVAGIDLAVDRVELLGSKTADVPSMLFGEDGVGVKTYSVSFIEEDYLKGLKLTKGKTATLVSESGRQFIVDYQGRVAPVAVEPQSEQNTESANGYDGF